MYGEGGVYKHCHLGSKTDIGTYICQDCHKEFSDIIPCQPIHKRECCEMCFQKFNSGFVHCLGITTCRCHQPSQEKESLGEDTDPPCPKCGNSNLTKDNTECRHEFPPDDWKYRFDKEWEEKWETGTTQDGDEVEINKGLIKDFISVELSKARQEERKRGLEQSEKSLETGKRISRKEVVELIKELRASGWKCTKQEDHPCEYSYEKALEDVLRSLT